MPTRVPERRGQTPSAAPVVQCLLALAEARTFTSRAEIAEQLGLSQMSISRLLTRILAPLRTRYRCG